MVLVLLAAALAATAAVVSSGAGGTPLSLEGKIVRYVRDPHGSGAMGIFVIDVDGRHERQIQPRTGGLFPAWAPNGRKIAFTGLTAEATASS